MRAVSYAPITAPAPKPAPHLAVPHVATGQKVRGSRVRTTTARPLSTGTPKAPLASSLPAQQSIEPHQTTAAQLEATSQVLPGVVGPLGLPGLPAASVIPGFAQFQGEQAAVSPKVQLAPPVP